MKNSFRTELEVRSDILNELVKKTTEKLKSFPAGYIYVKHRKDNVYFYLVSDEPNSEEKLLDNNEKEYIRSLIQKGYLEKVLKAAERELDVVMKLQRRYPKVLAEEVYDQLSPERKELVNPIIPTDKQIIDKWMSIPYIPKPISDDIPIYKTMRGERVRSKSEQIIADRLHVNGIPYKYECPLQVGDEIIHPDFTILRIRDRRILFYEHCGRMDDAQYANDMVDRSRKYELAGIRQGDKLFYSFESSLMPLDVRVIDQMINETFK